MFAVTLTEENKETGRYQDHPKHWDLRALKCSTRSYNIGNAYRIYERLRLASLCLTTLLNIEYHEEKPIKVLKTDLWNEGIERTKDVISIVSNVFKRKILFYGIDISHYVTTKAMNRLRYVNAVQSSITHIPFRNSFFDAIFDLSTIDHVPYEHRGNIIKEYFRCLRPEGLLLLVIDSLNVYSKIAKTLSSEKISKLLAHGEDSLPEHPNTIRARVKEFFNIIQEGCIDLAYPIFRFIFSGRKSRVFKALLNRVYVFKILYSVENSSILRKMPFLCRQYYLICRRK